MRPENKAAYINGYNAFYSKKRSPYSSEKRPMLYRYWKRGFNAAKDGKPLKYALTPKQKPKPRRDIFSTPVSIFLNSVNKNV